MLSKQATIEEMITAVINYAKEHYDEDGWDFIVECWDREDIQQDLEEDGCSTIEEAIKSFQSTAKLMDDRRKDIGNA